MASRIVSPIRDAGRLLIITVAEPSITRPGPCGGIGRGVTHAWMSAPPDAAEIALDIELKAAVLAASSANFAAGAPGVPAAAVEAATAVWIAVSATVFAAWSAATAASGIPRHAGRKPIKTFKLPGPGDSTGGSGWTTLSVILAAGPVGICLFIDSGLQPAVLQRKGHNALIFLIFSKKCVDVPEEGF